MSEQPDNIESSETLKSPGAQLAAARKKRKLNHAKVADKLRLSVQTIKDIEADDYKHLRAEIYVRGYLRAYARLLELDPAPVLASFTSHGFHQQFEDRSINMDYVTAGGNAVTNSFDRVRQHIIRWGSVGLVAILLALVIVWWHAQSHNPHAIVPASYTAPMTPTDTTNQIHIPVTVQTKTSHE